MISDNEIIEKLKIYMSGTRDNGVTPAWQHPIEVLHVFEEMQKEVGYARDIDLEDDFEKDQRETVIEIIRKSCLLHDIIEDGIKEDGTLFDCYDLAIIVKCCDRISNLREAVNTFKPYRLERYKWETKMFIIPLAKELDYYLIWQNWFLDQLEELSYTEHQPRKENVKRRTNSETT